MHSIRRLILIGLASLYTISTYAQNSIYSLGLWNLTNLYGELKAGALYGILTTREYGLNNSTKTTNYYGGIMLGARTYIWDPSFMKLNFEGAYSPESYQNQNLIFPNRYDIINTKRFNINSTLFEGKAISLSGVANFINTYDSRDNLTDINSNSKGYGGTISIRNRLLPFSVSANQSDWDSREMQTGHTYYYKQFNLNALASKTFFRRDRNELRYTHNDNWRQDYNMIPIRNISDNLELYDAFPLDSTGRSFYNSRIYGIQQHGVDSFQQLNINENISYVLARNMQVNGNYSFYDDVHPLVNIIQNTAGFNFGYQLFQSLHLNANYQYMNASSSDYHETTNNVGFNIGYIKRIPWKGELSLNYSYNKIFDKHQSQDILLTIYNEEYVLNDNLLVLFKRPFVIESSIVVKDVTSTTIYRLNIDYLLLNNNGYIEIKRIPGGLIPNNTSVYISYTANQPGNYQYEVNSSAFSGNIALFKRFLNLYVNVNTQNYTNVVNTDNLNLDYLTHYVYGARVERDFFSVGAELEDNMSHIYPYKSARGFLGLHGYLGTRFVYSFNANARDYYQLPNNESSRQFYDASSMLSYKVSYKSKLDFSLAYQKQVGLGLDLDLFTAKLRFSTIYRGMNFIFGIDNYERTYLLTQTTDYTGGYIQVIKKF